MEHRITYTEWLERIEMLLEVATDGGISQCEPNYWRALWHLGLSPFKAAEFAISRLVKSRKRCGNE